MPLHPSAGRRLWEKAKRVLRKVYEAAPNQAPEWISAATSYASNWKIAKSPPAAPASPPIPNPFEAFFDARKEGPGIWKWRHYFDIYHRHFQAFLAQDTVHLLEIGIYSGGSLDMWRAFFGDRLRVYGVDIEPACKAYESTIVRIFIGDQADRSFLKKLVAEIPRLDIVIDDGGHTPDQQRATLEELLPHISPGGVYVCEDIHETGNLFSCYLSGLTTSLNNMAGYVESHENPERRLVVPSSAFQSAIHSVCLYPYIAVVQMNSSPVTEFVAPKHGTRWEPFLR